MFIPQNIIDDLRQRSCEELADRLGIEVRRHKAYCFLHSESVPSLSFHPSKKNVWHCFSCGKGGDAVSLMMEYEGCGFREACEKLCAIYGISLLAGNASYIPKRRLKHRYIPMMNKPDNDKPFDAEIAEWLLDNMTLTGDAESFLFQKRKLNRDIISEIGIKALDDSRALSHKAHMVFGKDRCIESGLFGEKGYLSFWTPCLIFPYRDQKGKLLGLQSRYLGDHKNAPRFQFLSHQKTHLFNMPILKEINSDQELYITEGVTDCLAMLSSGKMAVAIPSATIIPEDDLALLKAYKLCMMPDNDEAGWDGFMKLRLSLIKIGIRIYRKDIPSDYKDYGEWYISGLKI